VLRLSGLILVAVALLSVAGCGGSLAPPDGGGGNGGTGSGGTTGAGGTTGIGGSIGPLDARSDIATCLDDVPATPVAGTPCRYLIPVPPCDIADPGHIGVKVDGVEIARDTTHTNGWDYTDATFTAVDIQGPICDQLTSGALTTVTISFRIILI
jgi:hypothetical protein